MFFFHGFSLLKWMIWGFYHYFWKHPCICCKVDSSKNITLAQNKENEGALLAICRCWTLKIMGKTSNFHPCFHRVFHYKPSILGYHYFWKHPKWPQFSFWIQSISFKVSIKRYKSHPGNSAGDLFGMVKTWPFQKVVGDIQRLGMKRSRLESPWCGHVSCGFQEVSGGDIQLLV